MERTKATELFFGCWSVTSFNAPKRSSLLFSESYCRWCTAQYCRPGFRFCPHRLPEAVLAQQMGEDNLRNLASGLAATTSCSEEEDEPPELELGKSFFSTAFRIFFVSAVRRDLRTRLEWSTWSFWDHCKWGLHNSSSNVR